FNDLHASRDQSIWENHRHCKCDGAVRAWLMNAKPLHCAVPEYPDLQTEWRTTMSRRIVFITLGLLLLLLSCSSFAQTMVTCSSDNMRRNYCEVGQNGGVRMIRQRSD